MADAKLNRRGMSVTEFLTKLDDPQKRADSQVLVEMMRRVTGKKPRCGSMASSASASITTNTPSGHEGDAPLAAFSPRKAEFSIYLGPGRRDERSDLLSRLGKHRMGKGCLYVKRLDQVDLDVLEDLSGNVGRADSPRRPILEVSAAKSLKRKGPQSRFRNCGPWGKHPPHC